MLALACLQAFSLACLGFVRPFVVLPLAFDTWLVLPLLGFVTLVVALQPWPLPDLSLLAFGLAWLLACGLAAGYWPGLPWLLVALVALACCSPQALALHPHRPWPWLCLWLLSWLVFRPWLAWLGLVSGSCLGYACLASPKL